jgi:DNA-binding MarR family transcriptional regulator
MKSKLCVYPQNESLGYILHRLDTLLIATLERSFQAHGFNVTSEQWGVLSKLWEGDGMHQAELSERVNKDKHNVTRILNLLERNGFVRRARDAKDRRLCKVHVTEKGMSLKDKLPPVAKGALRSAVKGLSDEDYENLWRILQLMVTNLEGLRRTKAKGVKNGVREK